MIVKLVRHGQSQANTGEADPLLVGDHRIPLSALGVEQARTAGASLRADFLHTALIYTSPYLRARQTLRSLFEGAGLSTDPEKMPVVYEDPRLREVDHGYGDIKSQQELRALHGWFYYRYSGGESPADCYDRTSGFLEGMMRQVTKKGCSGILIVTHGLALRCFVMRFLHLTVEQFEMIHNPHNCDIVTLADREALDRPQFVWGKWGVVGLRLDTPSTP
jgi:broad specificity phosphatase PhoE